jgi:hypothetical protein
MLDLQDTFKTPHQVHTMRVKKNITNADTVVTVATCNISRSASTIFTNTMLYYDFSSLVIKNANCYHPLLGSWGLHAKLFISRYDGEDMRVFDMPADRPLVPSDDAEGFGEAVGKEWFFPEWSNHPYYAAASLLVDRLYNKNGSWEHTENNESIYLINLKDSVYVKLIESIDTSFTSKTSFRYPFLWIEIPNGFHEDSTWLKSTIWERAAHGVIGSLKDKRSFYSSDNFFNGKDIIDFVLYSVSGKRIKTVQVERNVKINPLLALKNINAGVYLIGIKIRGVKERYVRWVVNK